MPVIHTNRVKLFGPHDHEAVKGSKEDPAVLAARYGMKVEDVLDVQAGRMTHVAAFCAINDVAVISVQLEVSDSASPGALVFEKFRQILRVGELLRPREALLLHLWRWAEGALNVNTVDEYVYVTKGVFGALSKEWAPFGV